MFEVRVVIWKCKNVPPMDSLEGMSDLFVKCWPEGMFMWVCLICLIWRHSFGIILVNGNTKTNDCITLL